MSNSNNALKFAEHDFADLRTNLQSFLKSQTVLSDYDVNASVLDTIISVLAYNTQNNAITANSLFAEGFIDSSTNRKNISMHAKHFAYLPFSRNSSKAVVNVVTVADLGTNPPNQLTLEKGTVFSGQGENLSYSYVTTKAYTASLVGDTYTFPEVEIYQGTYGSVDLIIDKSVISNIYEINIDNIDTSFLEVYVQDAIDSTNYESWSLAQDSILVDGNSKVYFMQETPNGRYGIEFGDDILGKSLSDGITVRVVYLVTAGADSNNVRTFNFSYSPNSYSKINGPSYVTTVTTTQKSSGGFERETNSSVKKNAPKFYVSQNRGVIAQDYKDLIKIKFPFVNSVSIWSGKEGNGLQDQFGRIYISANTEKSQFLTESQKSDIVDDVIDKYGVSGIIPVIVDVNNTYIDVTTTVYVKDYVHLTTVRIDDVVREYIAQYNEDNLEQFEGVFEHSRFVSGIDDLDSVISSNITDVKLHKRIYPVTGTSTSLSFTFHNKIKDIVSNSFVYGDNLKNVFMKSTETGDIDLREVINGSEILVKKAVGNVDFKTGNVNINDIVIHKANSTTKDIRFYATPSVDNVLSQRNNICLISDINIAVERK